MTNDDLKQVSENLEISRTADALKEDAGVKIQIIQRVEQPPKKEWEPPPPLTASETIQVAVFLLLVFGILLWLTVELAL